MYFSSKTTFEILPDEMILEICRYLHCSHVLYSLFDLNTRINKTITSYYQHVWFRRASYKQLIYIYENILPRIGSFIISLTIHPLHQSSFPLSFKQEFSNIFPHLKVLTLTSWKNENILLFIINNLQQMNYLEKLILQELSCSSSTIEHLDFLIKIFEIKNNFLKQIIFHYDCDSFNLNNNNSLIKSFQFNHILYLTIQLNTLKDFSILCNFIPNIFQLDITIKDSSLESVSFETKLLYLKQFSIWAIHYYSNFNDLISLISIVPSIEQLSLTLTTRDINLINGEKILSIFSNQLKEFNYTVCYNIQDNYDEFNINTIKQSWKTIPIIYSICENDKRIFLHTLPYSSSRLTIRSSLAKNIPMNNFYEIYSKIDEIEVYAMTNIEDIFPMLTQCRRIRELTLLISNSSTTVNVNTNKPPIKLPYLKRLYLLTIEGIPSDLHHLKELLIAASNLSILVIDLDCLLTILENENESLILYVLFHQHILDLCIRIEGSNQVEKAKKSKITIEEIHLIARIFTRIRNLTIDYESSGEFIESNLIKSVINEFKHLVIFHIYGKIPYHMINDDIRQWILQQNPFRIKSTDIFRVECSNDWFKLWL